MNRIIAVKPIGDGWSVQAEAFESEGGFTERLYRIRSKRRKS